MFLKLGIEEYSTITLHLNIMRKPVKKGLKNNYGLIEGIKKVKAFQKLSDIFNQNAIGIAENQEAIEIELAEEQTEMLSSFLDFYINSLLEQAAEEALEDENDIIKQLINVNRAVKEIGYELSTV